MMKYILFFCFINLNIAAVYAQTIDKDAVIITKQNDTLRTSIKVKLLVGKELWISGSAFNNKIYFSTPADKEFINSADVKYLEFKLDSNKMVFVSKDQVPEIKQKNALVQQMQAGKLNWYKTYSWSSNTEDVTDHFFLKGQDAYSTGLLTSYKKALKKATADKPDLERMIDDIRGYSLIGDSRDIKKVITAFNKAN